MYRRFVKPLLDRLLALVSIMVLSPLMIVVAILIKVGSEGPIFFRQERSGKNQEIFKVNKFRTMAKDAVKHQKVGVEVTGSDARITSFGKFLRRFKIDELAQLINILMGDMSIVGPRPMLPEYIVQYEIENLGNRFFVG